MSKHPDGLVSRRVTFEFTPPLHCEFADLRGELLHWRTYTPLARDAGGKLTATLELPVGAYAYKFRTADDRWFLDEKNPRTRGVGGVKNSLLVVGGTAEPILHASAAPFVYRQLDGRLCLRAGLRGGGGLTVRYDEGAGPRSVAMHPVAEEDEHTLLEAALPGTGARLDYVFVLDDGSTIGAEGGAGQWLSIFPQTLPPPLPPWWRGGALYSLFVDRFRRGGQPFKADASLERDSSLGGDLDGVTEALPYLASLGVTALHLTPIFVARSVHRYDVVDPFTIDPALGGDAAFERLLTEAHQRGLKILLDIPVTHVHRDFPPFVDVRRRGFASPYAPWFLIRTFPFREGYEPGYDHYQKGQWQEPLLNLEEPAVVEHLVQVFEHWTKRGVDGFRIDAAADVPFGLLTRLKDAVQAISPQAVVYGEVIPDNLHRFAPAAVDAATDFVAQQGLYGFLVRRDLDSAGLAALVAGRRFGRAGPPGTHLRFIGTHDQPRLKSQLYGDAARTRLGLLWTCLGADTPILYYGDEVGLWSQAAGRNFEDAWPDRQAMPWSEADWDHETLRLCRAALALRRAEPALSEGDEHPLLTGHPDVAGLRRQAGDATLELYLNRSMEDTRVALSAGAPSAAVVLLTTGEVSLMEAELHLGPGAGVVLRRVMPRALEETWEALRPLGPVLALDAFKAGQTELLALPSRLYLTVTEACNLRCEHCITRAPSLTASGKARRLKPWLLTALEAPLAAVTYLGFSHGGESLVSPALFDILAALKRARQGQPTDVHLLTNGMLATPARLLALTEAGVTSLAFSLDGASPETNDGLRRGARFERIVAHVAEAVALRRAGADLRVGLSCVIGAHNVHEIEALGELALRLGVDWLKVEEVFPTTARARHLMLPMQAPPLKAGLLALRAKLAQSPVVLVDHFDPPEGCACDPRAAAFRAADDFANRARLSPCRAAWEQACVDPDGVVHPIDYDHPALGSLLTTPFLELWNGPIAQRVRQEALRQVPTARRRACPGR